MATPLQKVLYTAYAHTTGGRDDRSVSEDGLLDVKLSVLKADWPGRCWRSAGVIAFWGCCL